MKWYFKCLKQYADFSGRARRKEYWMFFLFNIIFSFLIGMIAGLIVAFSGMMLPSSIGLLIMIYLLVVLIPSLAVAVRRLHDIGKSGWNYFFGLIPIVGTILLLVWFCTEGELGSNKWGGDPKVIEE